MSWTNVWRGNSWGSSFIEFIIENYGNENSSLLLTLDYVGRMKCCALENHFMKYLSIMWFKLVMHYFSKLCAKMVPIYACLCHGEKMFTFKLSFLISVPWLKIDQNWICSPSSLQNFWMNPFVLKRIYMLSGWSFNR